MNNYYITVVELPISVKGVVVPNPDGSDQIYINSLLCDAKRAKAMAHEILHSTRGDFYDRRSVAEIEEEVDRLTG